METKHVKHNRAKERGFTLVELITVLAITTLMTSAFVLNFRLANRERNLRTAADELASAIRQAQNLASTAKALPGADTVPPAYGVVVDKNASPQNYFVFADIDGNGFYEAGTDSVVGKTYTFNTSVRIADFANGAGNQQLDAGRIYITFLPPVPTTKLFRDRPTGTPTSVTNPPITILMAPDAGAPTWKVQVDSVSGRISGDSYIAP